MMHWKTYVLTKTGKELTLSHQGRKKDILVSLEQEHLTVISMGIDWKKTWQGFGGQERLSSAQLSLFFNDFSRMLQSGLSMNETTRTMEETTSDLRLKLAMEKIRLYINEGHSLKDSFQQSAIFPEVACLSLNAAEKSGQIPYIAARLGEYFEYCHNNKSKIIGSLIYPFLIFVVLTVACMVISVKLVPQLGFLLPPKQMRGFSVSFLICYADFMKQYWWLLIMAPMIFVCGMGYLWSFYRNQLIKYAFAIPILGDVLKEMEFTNIFLNLFIYLKSGISVTEALANVYATRKILMAEKLMLVKDRIRAGATLGEAFEKDKFFPSFISQSLKKGDETGRRAEYLFEIFKYYDSKSKESLKAVIKIISPCLMGLAFGFAGFIASFYILIYRNIGTIGAGIYH